MIDFKEHLLHDKICQIASQIASEKKINAFVIGGYVRDIIIKRQTTDIDFVVEGDGIEFARAVVEQLNPAPALTIFKSFQTAHFVFENKVYEFVGARRESYSRNSRNPLVKPGSIEEDLKRRDFTINILHLSLNKDTLGTLYDPFGGIEDIKKKCIKTPLDPVRTFDDDPLRMMRAIRFAAQLGFTIHDDCFEAIKLLAERILIVAPERIAEELNKMLMVRKPSHAFHLLSESGLLKKILPEISALSGVERIGKYAHKDILYHTLEVLDNVAEISDNIWLRWAALLHDVGKPPTKRFQQGHGWTFHGHAEVGMRLTEKIFQRLKLPLNEKLDYVRKIVGLHLRPIDLVEEEVTDSAIRRLLFDAGDDVDDLMLLCRADITSKNEAKVKQFLKNFDKVNEKLIEVETKDKLRNWQPPISGEIIMETFGLKPSKEVGIIKTAIREAILDGIISNNYDEAYEYMIAFAKSMNIESA